MRFDLTNNIIIRAHIIVSSFESKRVQTRVSGCKNRGNPQKKWPGFEHETRNILSLLDSLVLTTSAERIDI